MPVLLRVYALLPETRIWKYFGSLLVRKNCYRNLTNPTLSFSAPRLASTLGCEVYPITRFLGHWLTRVEGSIQAHQPQESLFMQKPAVCHAYSWREAERR